MQLSDTEKAAPLLFLLVLFASVPEFLNSERLIQNCIACKMWATYRKVQWSGPTRHVASSASWYSVCLRIRKAHRHHRSHCRAIVWCSVRNAARVRYGVYGVVRTSVELSVAELPNLFTLGRLWWVIRGFTVHCWRNKFQKPNLAMLMKEFSASASYAK